MMSKTHVAMGVATSFAIIRPTTLSGCCVTTVGGAVGGIICDIDTLKNDYKNDARNGQLIAASITVVMFILDFILKLGTIEYMLKQNIVFISIGALIFAITWIVGYKANHRTFTHSFLALILFSMAIVLMCEPVAVSFTIGFLSHLLLDLLNKKDLQLLYPKKKGFCLKLCYANKMANKLFLIIGILGTMFFIFNGLYLHLI